MSEGLKIAVPCCSDQLWTSAPVLPPGLNSRAPPVTEALLPASLVRGSLGLGELDGQGPGQSLDSASCRGWSKGTALEFHFPSCPVLREELTHRCLAFSASQ